MLLLVNAGGREHESDSLIGGSKSFVYDSCDASMKTSLMSFVHSNFDAEDVNDTYRHDYDDDILLLSLWLSSFIDEEAKILPKDCWKLGTWSCLS
jgi:hypothetical protein